LGSVELTIVDHDVTKAEALAELYGASVAPNFTEALAKVDAVDLCVPTDVHADLALEAIDAGKAILCEKPLSRTLDQAAELVRAVRKSGVPFMTAQVARYFPDFRRIHDLVVSGAVGKPAAIRTHRGGATPKGSDLWFLDHRRSGGVLLDVAVHDFDWLLWTIGPVEEVSARAKTAIDGKGADYALTTLKFENGAVGHVETTWMDPAGFRTSVEVAGSTGLVQYDSRTSATLKLTTEEKITHEMNVVPEDDPYFLQAKAFIEAVSSGQVTPVGVEDGFKAVSVAFAALKSAHTGRKVKPAPLP
jgi:predicted dehydrogenase